MMKADTQDATAPKRPPQARNTETDIGAAIFNLIVASTNAHAARIRAMTPEQVREMARAEMQQIREWERRHPSGAMAKRLDQRITPT